MNWLARLTLLLATVTSLLCTAGSASAAVFSADTHEVYPGDFNGDGKSDLLVIAKDPSALSGIYATDASGQPSTLLQSWNSGYLGISWHESRYVAVIGNFDGVGGDDVLLQRRGTGTSFLLPTNAQGEIQGVSQNIPGWGTDSFRILAGKFDGDAREDVFLQASKPSGNSMVVLADGVSHLTIINQVLPNNHLGFKWSVADAIVHVGDFNADGRDDLLVQAKSQIALIEDEVSIPVPVYLPNAFGIIRASPTGQFDAILELFSRRERGLDFAPTEVELVVGRFNDDGRADILLLSRKSGKPSYVVLTDGNAQLANAGVVDLGVGTLGAELRTLAGDFNGDGRSEVYRLASNASGSNSIVAFTNSGSIAANLTHSPTPLSSITALTVGRIEGAGSVSGSGAAQYEIPLTLPPGPEGIQPQLSLTYDSQRGNGMLGPGWSLSGLPAITRCNRTLAQDGAPAAVSLSYADAFCLDGKRLRITNGTLANYGQAGTTYDTEIAQFARITALGSAGNGPAHFILEAKSGLIYEFGNSLDSRIKSNASVDTPYLWLMNKVRNRSGTSYVVSYGTGAAGSAGVGVPLSIAYAPLSAGASSYSHTVSFSYTPKVTQMPGTSDPGTTGFIAGTQVVNTNLLLGIDVAIAGTLTRRYTLQYEVAPATTRARLAKVFECAGNAGTTCLAPTTIGYQNGAAAVFSTPVAVTTGPATLIGTPDLNGDGRDDLVYGDGALKAVFSTEAGLSTSVTVAAAAGAAVGHAVLGTGRPGLLVQQSNSYVLYHWNGSAFAATSLGAVPGSTVSTSLIDVNGDGRDDLVSITSVRAGQINGTVTVTPRIRFNTSTGQEVSYAAEVASAPYVLQCSTGPNCGVDVFTGTQQIAGVRQLDFNGDGRAEVVLGTLVEEREEGLPRPTVIRGTVTLFGSGTGFTLDGTGGFSVSNGAWFGHWNDDACTDILSGTVLQLSSCNAQPGALVQLPALAAGVFDWNGDGHSDVLLRNGSTLGVALAMGTGVSPIIPTSIPIPAAGIFVFDTDGDGQAELGVRTTTGISFYPHNSPGVPPDLVTSITDGYGIAFNPSYVSLARGSYEKGNDALYPERDYQGSLYVVSSFASTTSASAAGAPASFTQSFTYSRARTHSQGRGFEGFEVKRTQDSRNGLVVSEHFHRTFPYAGTVKKVEVFQPNGSTLISRAENTWSTYTYGSGTEIRLLPYVSSSSQASYEVGGPYDGALLSTAASTTTVDVASGSVTDSTTTVTEASSGNGGAPGQSHTSRTYIPMLFNDVGAWCIGRPGRVEQINSHTGAAGTQLKRTASLDWDGANCRPTQSTVEPDDNQWRVTTSIGYDGFGNPNTVTVTPAAGQGQAARTITLDWGSTGRFPLSVMNPKSQLTQFTWNEAYGARASLTDPNGLTASWQYDIFGRMTRQQSPDGTAIEVQRGACKGNCGSPDLRSFVSVITRDANNAGVRTDSQYFDAEDRVRFSIDTLLSGASSTTETRYDEFGRLKLASTPYVVGSDPAWYQTYVYDVLGRLTQVQRPTSESDSSTHLTQISYLGLSTSATDALNRTSTRRLNALGQVVQSIDAAGSDTDYEYDAFGQLLKTTDVANNQIVLVYNVRGFKTSSNDPDLGLWNYSYFPLGELKSQTTARGHTVSFTYDALSRPLTRSEDEGLTTWTWDTASKGIGALAAVSSPGGYAEQYFYDSVGRPSQQTITADAATYSFNQTYNALGRLDTLTYPTSTNGVRFKVRHGYVYGLEQTVREYTGDVPGTLFWQANATNAAGQLIDEQLGNGVRTLSSFDRITGQLTNRTAGVGSGAALQNLAYTWDKAGNLTQRQDLRQSLTEAFHYDALYRLDYSTLNGVVNLDLAYDAIGNLASKSDVGSYSYHPTKKHAVSTAGSNSYTYDANGNAITRNGASINWTTYNLPSLISGTAGNSSAFSYGPERQRWKQQASYGGTAETTLYIGGLLEKVTLAGVTSWRHHILGGSGEIAVHTRKSSGGTDTHYLSKDHLGSTDLITNASGAVETRSSFSAFGQRRNAAGWSGNPTPADTAAITDTTRHGYTGHEMLDNLNLTHMNGRVYDQITGRFLSPDPFVQAPFDGQSLNRYSYVFNNPLSLTDPSGFQAGPDEPLPPPKCNDSCKASAAAAEIRSMAALAAARIKGSTNLTSEVRRRQGLVDQANRVDAAYTRQFGPPQVVDPTVSGLPAPTVRPFQLNPVNSRAGVDGGSAVDGTPSLGLTLLSVGVGSLPVLGSLQSFGELFTGRDLITGENTSRLLAAAGILAGVVGAKGLLKAATNADDIIAGGRKAGRSIFNPSGGTRNCVNGVCAFLNTIRTKTLQTASDNVADNFGSIPAARNQIAERTGAFFGKPQLNALDTARDRQFFVVFTGADFLRSSHVAVGVVNKGNKTIFDPQTGETFKKLSDFSDNFVAFPLIFK